MLKDKIIIVIGGGGLIGREIVKDIRKNGATVIDTDIVYETNWEKGTYKLDVTSQESIDALVKDVLEHYGRIDGLVNSGYS